MARTLDQIKEEMDANNTLSLSSSAVAEWKLWRNIVAIAIWTFENILDIFKSQIDAALASKQLGTPNWYVNVTKQYQTEGNLIVNSFGQIVYDILKPDKQIVTNVSVTETEEGVVSMKVAKQENGVLAPLTNAELGLLEQYLTEIKYCGTRIALTSVNSDLIKYDLLIYFDHANNLSELKDKVDAVILAYKTNLNFNGIFYSTAFLDAIYKVPGVLAVKVNELQGKSSIGTYEEIDPIYELISGYFNYDASSVLTYE